MSTSCRRTDGAGGFTLLELAVALAIVTAAIVLAAPQLTALLRNNQEAATRTQAREIHEGIFGVPDEGRYGFLGDIGRLPATLSELVVQGALPSFSAAPGGVANVGNVGYGWQGPYVRSAGTNDDWTRDAWGQPFAWATTGATAGQVISGGPDGVVGNSDDIKYPLTPPPTTGTLHVNVVANGIANAFGTAVKVYYPVNGVQTGTAMQSYDPGVNPGFDGYGFTGLPAGVRAAIINHTDSGCPGCGTNARVVPVTIRAGQTNFLEVRMTTSCQVSVLGSLSCAIPAITP